MYKCKVGNVWLGTNTCKTDVHVLIGHTLNMGHPKKGVQSEAV